MTLFNYLDYVILPILSLSMVLTFVRFIKGPRVVDRVIALDLIITIGIGFITIFSIRSGKELFLDVAMILALIAFLSTVAFSYYLDKKA
jgi:multicomponent Na+:H+ antiporter subunit F